MIIYFIRHAKTNNNLEDRWQGSGGDSTISFVGQKELENLKKTLTFVPDVVFSSPLKRATETAHFICENSDVLIDELLIERNFGLLEGIKTDYNIKDQIGDFDLNTDLNLGIEKIQDMYFKRIKPFLDSIKANHQGKKIIIVSHS